MPSPSFLRRPTGFTREDFRHSPMLVFYEVTQACDLVCQHCRACAQAESDPNELSPDHSRLLIDQMADFPRKPMLVLTGGDPLKRPDIFNLIEYAKGAGLDVSITPSATPLVTRQAIQRLHDVGISRMAISIDGSNAGSHDTMRGVSGSFQCTHNPRVESPVCRQLESPVCRQLESPVCRQLHHQ